MGSYQKDEETEEQKLNRKEPNIPMLLDDSKRPNPVVSIVSEKPEDEKQPEEK